MANEFLVISDGTYTLSETENKNQFYFYRNDGAVLTDRDSEPMDLYEVYIMQKMMNGEITTDAVMYNIHSEMSDDEKCIRLTIYDIGEEKVRNTSSTANNKHPNFLKRLFYKIFG